MTHTYNKSTKPVHYKSYTPAELSIEETSRKISGYLAIFNNKDSDDDILIKGCFSKSLLDRGVNSPSNRKIAFLWQHKMEEPLGRFTLLQEDNRGLYFEAEVDDIDLGNRAIKQLKSGTLNQFSIGYQYVWDKCEWDEGQRALIVKEVKLFEGSIVTIGCNEATFFAGMKAESKRLKEKELVKETEGLIKELPIELQYKTRQIISNHISLVSIEPTTLLTHTKSNLDTDAIKNLLLNFKIY